MSSPDDQRTSFIPPNFIEKGKILNGTFDIRNAIEAILFALLIGVPVVQSRIVAMSFCEPRS